MMTLWTYGGGNLLQHVFNAIAMFFGTSTITSFIRLIGLISVIYAVISAHMRQSVLHGVIPFLWFVTASHLLFIPKTTLFIHDTISQNHHVVSNVPWALGIMASTISSCMHNISTKAESVYSSPHHTPYHKTGMVFGSRLSLSLLKAPLLDGETKHRLHVFAKKCIVPNALIGYSTSINKLRASRHIWQDIKDSAHPTLGFYWHPDNPKSFVNCQQAVDKLEPIITQATSHQNLNRTALLHGFESLSHPDIYLQSLAEKHAQAATQSLANIMIFHTLINNTHPSLNLAYAQGQMQQHWSAQIGWRIAEDFLPSLKTFLEALAYAAFALVALLALLPGGWSTFLTFMGLFAWIQSWPFFFTILNMIIDAEHKPPQDPLSLDTLNHFISTHSHIVDLAGLFALSVPPLSYMILKGGAGAIVHLAHHLGSQLQSVVSQQAHNLSSGNTHLANTAIDTHQAHQTHAFTHDKRLEDTGSGIQLVHNDGTRNTITASGQSIVQQGPGITHSQLAFSLHSKESLDSILKEEASLQQQQANHFASLFQASNALAIQKSLNGQDSFSVGSGQASTQAASTYYTQKESIQNILSFQDDITKSHNMSTSDAQRVAWGMAMSLPLPSLLGPSYNHSLSSDKTTSSLLSSLQQKAEQYGIQNSWENITNTSQVNQLSVNSSSDQRLISDIQESFQNSRQHLESWQQTQTKSNILTHAAHNSYNKQDGYTIDNTEAFLQFVMSQQSISKLQAMHAINQDPALRQKLLEQFFEKQWQKTVLPLAQTHTAPFQNQAISELNHDIKHFIKKALYHHNTSQQLPTLESQFLDHKSTTFNTIRTHIDAIRKEKP